MGPRDRLAPLAQPLPHCLPFPTPTFLSAMGISKRRASAQTGPALPANAPHTLSFPPGGSSLAEFLEILPLASSICRKLGRVLIFSLESN